MAGFPELRQDANLAEVIRWGNSLTRALDQRILETAVGEFTLDIDETATVVSDQAITEVSKVFLMPVTSTAAAAVPTTIIGNVGEGFFTVTHDSDTSADRTFFYAAIEEEQGGVDVGLVLIEFDPENKDSWQHWADATKHIPSALELTGGTHTLVDILSGVVSKRFFLWLSPTSAAITEIVHYPQLKEGLVFLAAGNLDDIKTWQLPGGVLDQWGKDNECDRMSYCGRAGFERVLDGWDKVQSYCFRSFNNE